MLFKNTMDFQFRATQGTETAPAAPQTAKGAARSDWKSGKNTSLFDDSSLQREDGTRCAVRRPAVQMYDSILKRISVRVFDVFFVSLARHLASSHSMASRISHVSEILLGHGFQIARHMTRSRKIYQKSTCFWWFNLKSYFWKANAAKRLFWCPRPWGGESSKSLVFLILLRCSWLCVCTFARNSSRMGPPSDQFCSLFDAFRAPGANKTLSFLDYVSCRR